METRGYILSGSAVLRPPLVDALLADAAVEEGWQSIFRERDVMDPYRLQKSINDGKLIQQLENAVKSTVEKANKGWRPTRWFFLKSLPGGEIQAIHRDYLNAEVSEMELEELPGSCILAINKPAQLATYGWNRLRALQREEQIVTIPSGSACIFRGDLIHRGMAYDSINIRVHCYLDLVDQDPIPNSTEIVLFKAFRCFHCSIQLPTYRLKKEHQKACTTFVCPTCVGADGNPRSFTNFETLKTHRRRHHRGQNRQ